MKVFMIGGTGLLGSEAAWKGHIINALRMAGFVQPTQCPAIKIMCTNTKLCSMMKGVLCYKYTLKDRLERSSLFSLYKGNFISINMI